MENMDNNEVKTEETEINPKTDEAKTNTGFINPHTSQKSKAPIYKKWWFWGIIGVLVIAIATGSSGGNSDTYDQSDKSDSPSESDTNNNASSKVWMSAGTYKVGKDIDAGEYFVKCTSYNCYIQVSSDSSGTLDSIIANDNISTHTYITVRDGEYLTITGGKFALATKVDPQQPDSNGIYGEGMYKVGKDIPAGEYKVVATNSCYIEVSSNSNNTLNSIISNNNIEVGTSTYITVSDGQYLKVNGGKIIAE